MEQPDILHQAAREVIPTSGFSFSLREHMGQLVPRVIPSSVNKRTVSGAKFVLTGFLKSTPASNACSATADDRARQARRGRHQLHRKLLQLVSASYLQAARVHGT
jgi:hypothetical protein